MTDTAQSLGLIFNEEIYNYIELRRELLQAGETFRTTSDTEVLPKLLMRDKADCVSKLRGMFAFAAFDDHRGTLLLARDRVGKKPLYRMIDDGCLYFSSALEALRRGGRSRLEIDPEALDLYLTLAMSPLRSPSTRASTICQRRQGGSRPCHRRSRRGWKR
jgi:asparagine synthase (glutamine-hydrolysing)